MERIERISNKHEQEERKEKGERERATKGQGKEKENHFLSLLLFTSFPLPCPRAIQLSFSYGLLAGCLHKGPRCHFWVSVGIGWSIGWKGVTFSSTRKPRWCNPMPRVNIQYTKKCDLMQAPSGSCFLTATEGNPAFQLLCKVCMGWPQCPNDIS